MSTSHVALTLRWLKTTHREWRAVNQDNETQPVDRGRSSSPRPSISSKTMSRSYSAPPRLEYAPGECSEESGFTVTSIPMVRRLLTLQVEEWGHRNFPEHWACPPETSIYVKDLPPIVLGKLGEDGSRFVCEDFAPFISGWKRGRSPSISLPSKQPKHDHNLDRSLTAMHSPPISVPGFAGEESFPLVITVRQRRPPFIITSWFLSSLKIEESYKGGTTV